MQVNARRALSVTLIATAMAMTLPATSFAVGGTPTTPSSGYSAAQAAVDAGSYRKAIGILADLAKSDPKNADVWNLLGYATRKLGDPAKAGKYYAYALQLNPRHLGALEYQGELFVETAQINRAHANLIKITEICGTNCEAYLDLAAMIRAAEQS